MAYRVHKHPPRNTASDKILHNKAFASASNPSYDGYQRGLTQMGYKSFEEDIDILLPLHEQTLFRKNIKWIMNYTSP